MRTLVSKYKKVISANLREHAEKEMQLAGLYDADADYGNMTPNAVLALIDAHREQGHSGCSSEIVLDIFNKLVNFKALTPLTDNPGEWLDVSEYGMGGDPLWQSKRQPDCFSKDGGKTYYCLDDVKTILNTKKSKVAGFDLKYIHEKLIPKHKSKYQAGGPISFEGDYQIDYGGKDNSFVVKMIGDPTVGLKGFNVFTVTPSEIKYGPDYLDWKMDVEKTEERYAVSLAKDLKDVIKKEKTAFFMQHSGLFDNFTPRARKDLESLPVTWSKVDTTGEQILSNESTEPTWVTADLVGNMDGKEVKLKIEKSPDRNIYTLMLEGKTYKASSMPKLKSTLDSLKEGGEPHPQMMQKFYNYLQHNENAVLDYVKKYYLEGLGDTWQLQLSKDVTRIYLKFTIDTEDTQKIIDSLKAHNFYRLDSVGSYLKALVEKNKMDASKFAMSHRFVKLADKAGFIITIK